MLTKVISICYWCNNKETKGWTNKTENKCKKNCEGFKEIFNTELCKQFSSNE